MVDKVGGQFGVPDKESHVNRAVKRIEKQIHVYILAQFSATNAATKRGICFQPPWEQEAFTERGDQISVALSSPQDGGNDASTPAAKNFDQLLHLLAHVRMYGTGIWKVQGTRCASGEGICDKSGLVGPPAVDCCFANAGMSSHFFNRKIGETMSSQNFQRTAQNGHTRLLAARASRSAGVAPAMVAVSRRLLA